MTKIKICGIKTPQDIEAVNKYLPDYIGFVFAPSNRQINFSLAKELKQNLNPNIKAVGVFVNEPLENIVKLADVIDLVQLHGNEPQQYITQLKSKINKPVIALSGTADFIMYDNSRGGSGKVFDWDTIKSARGAFLAGGLSASNVEAAIKKLNPYCVDVSSGAETNGIKDPEKIKEFISIVRSIK